MRKAGKTWGGDFYKMGGGIAAWDSMAYDPMPTLFTSVLAMPSLGFRNFAARKT